MKKTEEYQLVETIDYAGQVKRKTYRKRDLDHAAKGLADAILHKGDLLAVYTVEDSAYYRTLATKYHVETREVNAWTEVMVEVSTT